MMTTSLLSCLLFATPAAVAPANGVEAAVGPEGTYHLFKGNAPALYELTGPGTVKVHVRRAQTTQGPEKIRVLGLIDGEEVWATVLGNGTDEASGLPAAGKLQQGEFKIGAGPKTLVLRVPDADAGGFHVLLMLQAAPQEAPKPINLDQPALAPMPPAAPAAVAAAPEAPEAPPAPTAPAAASTPSEPAAPPAPAAPAATAATPGKGLALRVHAALVNSLVFGGLNSTGSELRLGADAAMAGGQLGVRIGVTGASAQGMLAPSVAGLSASGADKASSMTKISSTQIPVTLRYGLKLPGTSLHVNAQGGVVLGSLSGSIAEGESQGGGAFGLAGSLGASVSLPAGLEVGIELGGRSLSNAIGSSSTAALGVGIGYAYDL
ncbi:MAG: hypothetical protein CMH55_00575 [Myxococcales bacterium]|nr:hypothetical protein [Myxococcales bacterium]